MRNIPPVPCIGTPTHYGIYVYMFTLRNAISPYGEAHTVVLYARATRAAIARPRDCTFFHNYLTFFHNSTAKWTTIL